MLWTSIKKRPMTIRPETETGERAMKGAATHARNSHIDGTQDRSHAVSMPPNSFARTSIVDTVREDGEKAMVGIGCSQRSN